MAALKVLSIAALIYCCSGLSACTRKPAFRVIAFFTAKEDPAHISLFVKPSGGFRRWRRNTSSRMTPHPIGAI